MQLRFAQHGVQSVDRFAALDGNDIKIPEHWIHTPGAYGCLVSHLQVISEARQLGLSSVLIFEDDVVFDEHLNDNFESFIKEVPTDWDILFFGALHKDEPIRLAEHVVRISKANSTYAYALRSTVFDDFIELNRNAADVLDNNNYVLQQRFNCYCFMPNLAWVENEYSDVQKRLERHWYLERSLVLFGHRVDTLLSQTTIVFAYNDCTGNETVRANLMFLAHYYQEFFSPFIAMVIVEQGRKPTIDSLSLPESCKYVLVPAEGPLNRERCFNVGIINADPQRKFLILSDSDIYLETLDIRANLKMCEEYDAVTGFTKVIDFTHENSLRLRETNTTRGIEITMNAASNVAPSYCCFHNRETIDTLGGWHEGLLKETSALPLDQPKPHRVFQSPNHALRLH